MTGATRRVLGLSLLAVAAGIGSACGSSASDGGPASGGASGAAGFGAAGTGGSSGASAGAGGQDAGGGNAGDASTADAPADAAPDLKGWTQQASFLQIVKAGGWTSKGLLVDPHAAGRLALEFQKQANQAWYLIWEKGTFSKKLEEDASVTSDGAGFDALGHFYLYYRTSADAFVAHWPNLNKSWDTIKLDVPAGYYPSWPPTQLSVAMGSLPRVGLYSSSRLFDATGKVDSAGYLSWDVLPPAQWQPSSLDGNGFSSLAFVPGKPSEFYVTTSSANSLARCTSSSTAVTCQELHGFASAPSALWLTPANPDLLCLRVKNAAGDWELRLSTDGGKTTNAIPHPFGTQFVSVALSPKDAKTIVVWKDGNTDLQVSHDQGASWNPAALPEAGNTSLSGAGIDNAGTLFLVRGDALFSRSAY